MNDALNAVLVLALCSTSLMLDPVLSAAWS